MTKASEPVSHVDRPDCPDHALLDACARGRLVESDLRRHIATCAICLSEIAEIQENNAFLEQMVPAFKTGGLTPTHPRDSENSLPGYQIIREISRGGQGIVYLAIQTSTKRTVALKLPLTGHLATARQRQRFEREVEIVAALRHPHIVTLYGTETLPGGRTVLVMEYVVGERLDRYFRGAQNPDVAADQTKGMLRLFVKICDAVNYAHQHGILHRDLKPANILVVHPHSAGQESREPGHDTAGESGRPDGARSAWSTGENSLEPRILDFGLAKAIDVDPFSGRNISTMPGEFMGTLAYAAPESVQGDPKGIDTRTDVYALGVMLYQALTGRLPYAMTGSLADGVRNIVDTEPEKPSVHCPWLGEELDAIVLKALAKDQQRRYQSARDLGLDIERFLAGSPIQAKSDSAWYLVRKTARRHKVPLAAAAAIVVLIAGFAVSMYVLAGRIATQRNALAASLAVSNLERGRLLGVTGTLPAAEDILWREFIRNVPAPSEPGPTGLARASNPIGFSNSPNYWSLWELYCRQPCLATMSVADPGTTATLPMAFNHDGTKLFTGVSGSNVKIWEIPSGRLSSTLQGPDERCHTVCTDARGESLVLWVPGAQVALWDVATKQYVRLDTDALGGAESLTNSNSREILAVGGRNGMLQTHDAVTGQMLQAWRAHAGPVSVMALSADLRMLATHSQGDHYVRMWDRETGNLLEEWKSLARLFFFCFSPDERTLAYMDPDRGEIVLWDIDSRRERLRLASQHGQIHSFAYSPDGRMIVAGGFNGELKVFDLASQRWVATHTGHAGDIGSIRFRADSRMLASAGLDGRIRLWESPPYVYPEAPKGLNDSVLSLDFSSNGRFLAAACGADGVVRLWNLESGADAPTSLRLDATASAVAFHPDAKTLATGSHNGTVKLWDIPTGALKDSMQADDKIACLAFSPDGKRLASSGEATSVKIWNVTNRATQELCLDGHRDRVPFVTWSPNGKTVASAGRDGAVILWNCADPQRRMTLRDHHGAVRCVQFSPDGAMIATSSDDQTIRLWNVETGRSVATLSGHMGQVWALCYSPDGRLVASGDHGGSIRLWDASNGRFLAAIDAPGPVYCLSFSFDGRTLAAGCDQPNPLTLWSLTHYDRRIAGNLEYQLRRIGTDTLAPDRVAGLRAWAENVHVRAAADGE